MSFLSRLWVECADFLFPPSPRQARLASLTTSQLASLLPPPEATGDEDVIALFGYHHPIVRNLVWEVKYGGNRMVARKLGELLSDTLAEELAERALFDNFSTPLLVPVPMSDKRRFERGWNQAELLCRAIVSARDTQPFKYLPRQLVKHRHTESQTKTGKRAERLANLKDSMQVLHPPSVAKQCVILVDDVTTTGATFKEARRALAEASARKVICIAVAH